MVIERLQEWLCENRARGCPHVGQNLSAHLQKSPTTGQSSTISKADIIFKIGQKMLCTICKRVRKIKETNLQIPRSEEEEQRDVLRHQSKDSPASCGGALGAVDGCALMKDAACGEPTKEPEGNKQEQ